MDKVVEVLEVSKSFEYVKEPYKSLKQSFVEFMRGTNVENRRFQVLQSITFSVSKGEILGIIGSNGAGKSTLLKVISGILYPNSGKIFIRGSVAPLIELGAGFHPEFTGLENIYLNSYVLGLTKKEVDDKLDWILSFSELRDFINWPLKCYSSGMQMRLGFSISAALEPDVFLIDESLAVGDARFVEKCIQRILELKRNGTAFLIASHDLENLKKVADKCILLEKGSITKEGPPDEVIQVYLGNSCHA